MTDRETLSGTSLGGISPDELVLKTEWSLAHDRAYEFYCGFRFCRSR
jgi:hypothetical protein